MGQILINGRIALWKWTQTCEYIVSNFLKQARNTTYLFTPLATFYGQVALDILFLHPIVMLFMEKVLGLRLLSGYVNIYSTNMLSEKNRNGISANVRVVSLWQVVSVFVVCNHK